MATGSFATDAIFSITTQYPELLSSLLAFIPALEGVEIPSDGSSVDLVLEGMPPGLTPKLAIKGQHLVVFEGPKSTATAGKMTFETPNKQGLYASSINYEKLGDMAHEVFNLYAKPSDFTASECADIQVTMTTFSNTKASITMKKYAVSEGVRFDLNGLVAKPSSNTQADIKPGNYQLLRLADGCEWVVVGTQSINADGTGQYIITDGTPACAVAQIQYNWQQKGGRIMFNETKSTERDSCSDSMKESTLKANECIILVASASGFDCLFMPSKDIKDIYRYVLLP